MKTHKLYILLALISFLSSSCSNFLFWEGEDERVNRTIEIANIEKIQIESIFYIELIQDEEEYIIATGSEDQLDKLKISSVENIFLFRHDYNNLIKNYTPIKLEIHLKDINYILVQSPSNISNSETMNINNIDIYITEKSELVEMDLNLNCKKLFLDVRGGVNGRFEFKGECPNASYVLNGATNIMALELKSQNVDIAQNSIGEAYLFAEKKITAKIYNFGNIYYKGSPEIIENRIQINNQSPTAKLIQISSPN